MFFLKNCRILRVLASAAFLSLLAPVDALWAQDSGGGPPPPLNSPAETRANPLNLASEFFEHDYFNYYAFVNGDWDSYAPVVRNGSVQNNGGYGFNVGGGVNGTHQFKDSVLSLSYRGDYNSYSSGSLGSGTDQNLSIGYSRRLTRHWTLSATGAAGIFYYGGTFFAPTVQESTVVQTNPFSPETKFVVTSISASYQQSRRLSYAIAGSYYLSRYNYIGAIGYTGGSGTASVNYRVTSRTTFGGSYAYTYFTYQHGAGQSSVNSVYLTLSRTFPKHWFASVSGGLSNTHANGFITLPISIITNGVPVTYYAIGKYDQTTQTPYIAASAGHSFRKSSVSISGGQAVAPGNGFYLATRTRFLNGVYSRSMRRSGISFGGSYFNNNSISNNVGASYSSTNFSIAYGYVVARYISANIRYDYLYYGTIGTGGGISDNRFSYGISFSSKSRPLSLY